MVRSRVNRYVPLEWRDRIKAKTKDLCAYCGRLAWPNINFDHIVPLSRGGLHVESNLQLTCRKCNTSKGNRSRPTWMDRM